MTNVATKQRSSSLLEVSEGRPLAVTPYPILHTQDITRVPYDQASHLLETLNPSAELQQTRSP